MKTNNSGGVAEVVLGIVSDICEGAKILDSYVIRKRTRMELSLENKNEPQKPILSMDRTWKCDKSILQLLVMMLGFAAAVGAFVCMAKIRKNEKKKMKAKIKKVKAEKNREIKKLRQQNS